MRFIAAFLLLIFSGPALAGLAETDLSKVEFSPPPNARVPLGLPFRNTEGAEMTIGQAAGGLPTLLLPVDYACRMTCGPALAIVSAALARTGLRPDEDFRLVLVGLNAASDGAAARSFTAAQIADPALMRATASLTGDPASIRALTEAIGYSYAPDQENQAFAHPIGLVALTADGRIARALSSLALDPTDLRLALIEAGEGRIGGIAGRLALLCYGFDPVHGLYTASIERLLAVTAALTIASLAAALVWFATRARPQGGGP
jgi:protein SCO1